MTAGAPLLKGCLRPLHAPQDETWATGIGATRSPGEDVGAGWGEGERLPQMSGDPSSELLAETSPVSLSPSTLSPCLRAWLPGGPGQTFVELTSDSFLQSLPSKPASRCHQTSPSSAHLSFSGSLLPGNRKQTWVWLSTGFSASSPISPSYFLLHKYTPHYVPDTVLSVLQILSLFMS